MHHESQLTTVAGSPLQASFQLVQSYVFNTLFVVSYQRVHWVGLDGADADTDASLIVISHVLLFTEVTHVLLIPYLLHWTPHRIFLFIGDIRWHIREPVVVIKVSQQ